MWTPSGHDTRPPVSRSPDHEFVVVLGVHDLTGLDGIAGRHPDPLGVGHVTAIGSAMVATTT